MTSEPQPFGGQAAAPDEPQIGMPQAVSKPWGEELWLAQNDRFAGKVLVIKKGGRLSLQYHERKHEVLYVESGLVKYTLGVSGRPEYREVIAEAGAHIDLPPGTVHRIEALEDSRLFEASTPELDDVVRLEDDYGRAGPPAGRAGPPAGRAGTNGSSADA